MSGYALIAFFSCIGLSAIGQVAFDGIFSDHMVLQRGKCLNLTGKAAPGAAVDVRFGDHSIKVQATSDASWRVQLPALMASAVPMDILAFSGPDTAIVRDVVVGDVWVCLGQSNMEWTMAREAHWVEERQHAAQPLIRFYNPTYAGKNVFGTPFSDSIVKRLQDGRFLEGVWQRPDSASLVTMSAVGWYFAKSVVESEGIPIGLLNLSVGGAPLESMMGIEEMFSHPVFRQKLQGNWLENDALPVWVRERGRQNVGGLSSIPADAMGPCHAFKPGFIHTFAIQPLQALPVRGLLCYQGESNAQEQARVDEYPELFVKMVEGLRRGWGDASLPMYFVQLSSIDTVRYKGHFWPAFRDGQRRILDRLPWSGMAVCSDHGLPNDVHPTEKLAVGERLARWALHDTYHRRVTPSGPLPSSARYRRGMVVVRFRYAKGGLRTTDSQPLRGFTLDGSIPAIARIQKSKVLIKTPIQPAHIYFGWKPFSDSNLGNKERLPASTFKMEVK